MSNLSIKGLSMLQSWHPRSLRKDAGEKNGSYPEKLQPLNTEADDILLS